MPLSQVEWHPCYRIIPSRFPPIDLFERVADPSDWEAVAELESLTNPRIRDGIGEIALVPPKERIAGAGASSVMAAFTHLNPSGSRFSDGRFGIYYCARDEQSAIIETVYHRERFLAESEQPPQTIEMRVYLSKLCAELTDLRKYAAAKPFLDPDSYMSSRALGWAVRSDGGDGIVYPSVRNPGGEGAAVMRPKVLTPAWQGRHYGYTWDGSRIRSVIELRQTAFRPR